MIKKRPYFIIFYLSFLFLITCCGSKTEHAQIFFKRGMKLFKKADYIKARLEFNNVIQLSPKSAQAYYMLGLCSYRLKNFIDAFKNFNTAIMLDPNLLDAQLKLGIIYLLFNKPKKALVKADLVLKKDPNNTRAFILKATALKKLKKYKKAINITQQLIITNPNNLDAYILLSSIYEKLKQYSLAKNILKRACNIFKNKPLIDLELAKLYINENRFIKAESIYKRLANSSTKAIYRIILIDFYIKTNQLLKANYNINLLINKNPNNYNYRLLKIDILVRLNKLKEAKKEINILIKKYPNRELTYLTLAKIYKKLNNTNKYIATLKKCIELSNNDILTINTFKLIIQFYIKRHNLNKASVEIDKFLKLYPTNIDAHYLRAIYFLKSNKPDNAIADLRFISQELPNNIDIYFLLVKAYTLNKQPILAESTAQRMLNIAVKRQRFKKVFTNLVNFYLLKQDYRHAIYMCEQYIKLLPNEKYFINNILGKIYFKSGSFEMAKETFLKNIRLKSNNITAYYNLATIYRLKFSNNAPNQYKALLIRKLSKNPQAWSMLAMLYEQQNNYNMAIKYYNYIIKKYPDYLDAINNLAFLYADKVPTIKNLARAKKLIERAIKKQPDQPDFLDTEGWIYYHLRQYKKALILFKKAISLQRRAAYYQHMEITYKKIREKTLQKLIPKSTI